MGANHDKDVHARTASKLSLKSEYDQDALLNSSQGLIELGVFHDDGILHSNLHIKSSDLRTLYFAKCTTLAGDGYGMKVYAGDSERDPLVGACSMKTLSMNILMAVGDPNDKAVEWQEITAKSVTEANFRFNIPTVSGGLELFEWRRSHGTDVKEAGGKWFSMRNMVLVRVADEQVVGVYVDNLFTGWSKKGKIQLKEDQGLGKEGEFVAMLAMLSINEKARRHVRGTSGYQAGGKFPI